MRLYLGLLWVVQQTNVLLDLVKAVHVFVGDFKVKDAEVLAKTLRIRALWDGGYAALHLMPNENLENSRVLP